MTLKWWSQGIGIASFVYLRSIESPDANVHNGSMAMRLRQFVFLCLFSTALARVTAADLPPSEWIDPDTGHRVIRLSTDPGTESLYFNINAWTA
ncbi:MAG: hypothetical protein ACREE6_07525, partial [Limisphaerales bacterium]